MDQFADIYYDASDNKHAGVGNVSDRVALRKNLHCKSFEWFVVHS